MPKFIETFKQRNDISFMGMRDVAMDLLPKNKAILDKLYDDLDRGKGILDDEQHLNCYLLSFGKMHKAKLDYAFERTPLDKILNNDIEIYDWGCGQGTATICLLDFLASKNIAPRITKIYLVDPSVPAVKRAADVISCYNPNFQVYQITKGFDDLRQTDFSRTNTKKLHLFSNILDVEAFDLANFIHLFQQTFSDDNYSICVGPYYSGNRRVDEFIAATCPDEVYATTNKGFGNWIKDWTISMRIFYKSFDKVETIQDIRKRIEESHKKDQFFAGYILDAISDEIGDTAKDIEALFKALSVFDVKSNIALNSTRNIDSKLAVLANIISRGLPTKAPVLLENYFSDFFGIAQKPQEGQILYYPSTHKIQKQHIYEVLHIIDPRFNADNYNGDILQSGFERDFVEKYLKGTDSEYLIQLFEPHRQLSSIVDVPNKTFPIDQRIDFSLEIPYGENQIGFICELDGVPYRSNIFQRLNDERRDRIFNDNGWDAYRIEDLDNFSSLNLWKQEASVNRYLSTIKRNYAKSITGEWRDALQMVLSPLAIARVERIMLEAMMSGVLDITQNEWNIVIIERDVPCAAIAVEDIQEKYNKISSLAGEDTKLPKINLCIVSTDEFKESPLHLNGNITLSVPEGTFDLCLDVSMLLRDNVDALPLKVDAKGIYLVRSSHYQKRDRRICSAENIQYPRFVDKTSLGEYENIPAREEVLTYFLREIFRKPNFRAGQLAILSNALVDKTTIGLLPTGGGKSLVYQLSCLLQPGVSIIVDPLVSLMIDQVRGMRELRIDSCDCVNSTMNANEKNKKLNLLQKGAVQLMLLSPERFMMENFRESLSTMSRRNHVYFAYGVIDEVHCVSEWGHDFRTSYLHLGRNMMTYMETKSGRPLSIIGLTATASFDVLADVERELTLGDRLVIDSDTIIRPENDTRPELTYRVVEVVSDYDRLRDPSNKHLLDVNNDWGLSNLVAETKRQTIRKLLLQIPEDIQKTNDAYPDSACHIHGYSSNDFYKPIDNHYQNAGIIFCPHTRGPMGVNDSSPQQMGVASGLTGNENLKIGTFVGGDQPFGDMKSFNENEQNLMVATKAFGMGIDKPNIRFTINFNHPSSIESFVQEAGRAGRDRKHAISYILYEPTEYIHLTVDKVNDIRYYMGKENDPLWLHNYVNKYILLRDFPALCQQNGCSEEQTKAMLQIIRYYGFAENVDKNVDLWFHNNSFRGLYKEKIILYEMTDRILNVKPTILLEVQGKLREATGNEDLVLKVGPNGNAVRILSEEDSRSQYGYIFLDNLHPTYNYVNFDRRTCTYVSQTLIDILNTYPDHSAMALLKPIDGSDDLTEGIYHAMAKADKDGYVYVTVSWENQVQQDPEEFELAIKHEITKIANKKGWKDINTQRYGEFKLHRIGDFDALLTEISKRSGDPNWLINHGDLNLYNALRNQFCKKRDKDDTDKAIYRMCCIGLVEDVTIDFLSQTYQLKIINRTDEEFKQNMLSFFRKYYSQEQAEKRVAEIDSQKGRNYKDKCLGYLAAFVYDNLERKRYRAIEDMRNACVDSISNRQQTGNDDWMKEFIHLYFNSKYARNGYQVDGKDYSLKDDTDIYGQDDFSVVRKYIEIIKTDASGSEVNNAKHLYGATLLCLRAHPDNAALQLLLTYCITFLGAGTNESLKNDAYNSFVEGFMSLYERYGSKIWGDVDYFLKCLETIVQDDYIRENIIECGRETIVLFIHEERLNQITKKYIK